MCSQNCGTRKKFQSVFQSASVPKVQKNQPPYPNKYMCHTEKIVLCFFSIIQSAGYELKSLA